MKTSEDWARSLVAGATNLDELLSALTRIDEAEDEDEDGRDLIDWTSLPTYGGGEPSRTEEIWSWDSDRLLVGECMPFEIVRREEWSA